MDPDALISVDVLLVSPDCPSLKGGDDGAASREELQIVSVQFNSLDVIANQETIVELLAFFRRIAPTSTNNTGRHRKGKRATVDQVCDENFFTFT